MKSLLLPVVCLLLVTGCAASTVAPGGGDLGGGKSICPDHPDQCGGKCCGSVCVDVTLDPRNCNDCGIVCGAGQLCQAGACGCLPSKVACGSGQSCCSTSGCKSLDTDAFNCGKCGVACPSGKCMAGQCVPCSGNCAVDMGVPVDMGASSGGSCQCSNHCAGDPVGWCVGTNCCYAAGVFGTCMIGPCQINMTP